jgi:hypothetical protein
MRLLLFILGVWWLSSALKNPPRPVRSAPITISGRTVSGAAGSQHCNNAWTTCVGLAGTVDLVRMLRRNHIHQLGSGGAKGPRGLRNSSGSLAALATIRPWPGCS